MTTPTDFAMDYGKHSNSGGSFDNSNGESLILRQISLFQTIFLILSFTLVSSCLVTIADGEWAFLSGWFWVDAEYAERRRS
jgi:hypothetical protein